jgi:hypothetical protein
MASSRAGRKWSKNYETKRRPAYPIASPSGGRSILFRTRARVFSGDVTDGLAFATTDPRYHQSTTNPGTPNNMAPLYPSCGSPYKEQPFLTLTTP